MGSFDKNVLWNQALALVMNIWNWFLLRFFPNFISVRKEPSADEPRAVQIDGPGGLNRLGLVPLDGRLTIGYNVSGFTPPFTPKNSEANIPADGVILSNQAFSINYADVTIRWGLYESALRFVGWPIVPGFDVSGVVEQAGPMSKFKPGDNVYGCSMFGAYSSRVLIPSNQLTLRPAVLSVEEAAGLPAVAGTALHALSLAGFWPQPPLTRNRAVLIHSAAGGVGLMLVQMAKILGCSPIVAVVGASHKVQTCRENGADEVIDKSKQNLWSVAKKAAGGLGFAAIFDANGVSTLSCSYDALGQCGRLVVYGFHSNLPRGEDILSPIQWLRMAVGLFRMPTFDAMKMTLENKAVIGFNLSFFADEHKIFSAYLGQINDWVVAGQLKLAKMSLFEMHQVAEAHKLIQSGRSIGKIVIRTGAPTKFA